MCCCLQCSFPDPARPHHAPTHLALQQAAPILCHNLQPCLERPFNKSAACNTVHAPCTHSTTTSDVHTVSQLKCDTLHPYLSTKVLLTIAMRPRTWHCDCGSTNRPPPKLAELPWKTTERRDVSTPLLAVLTRTVGGGQAARDARKQYQKVIRHARPWSTPGSKALPGAAPTHQLHITHSAPPVHAPHAPLTRSA